MKGFWILQSVRFISVKKSPAVQVHYSKCENSALMLVLMCTGYVCGSFEVSEAVAASLRSVSYEMIHFS